MRARVHALAGRERNFHFSSDSLFRLDRLDRLDNPNESGAFAVELLEKAGWTGWTRDRREARGHDPRRAADDRLFLTEGEIDLRVASARSIGRRPRMCSKNPACRGRTRYSASGDIGRLCAPFWTAAPGWRSLSPR